MKPFKTIDEQFELLKSRGMEFKNEEESKRFLLNNNYYNVINCFAKFFMDNNDNFLPGTNFEEIISIYYFDKEIKEALFKSILEIEHHFKSIVAYRFSEKYKDIQYSYLNVTNYNNKSILKVTETISTLSKIIKSNKDKANNSINHYVNKHNDVPLWILVSYLNFGQISYFYKYLDEQLQNDIARDFSYFLLKNLNNEKGKISQITPSILISFIGNIIDLRNAVAHNNRLLGFKCKGHTRYYKDLHKKYSISNSSIKQDVYNVFIVMQTFLTKVQYAKLHNTILKRVGTLNKKITTIDINIILSSLGFPNDWNKTTSKLSQTED